MGINIFDLTMMSHESGENMLHHSSNSLEMSEPAPLNDFRNSEAMSPITEQFSRPSLTNKYASRDLAFISLLTAASDTLEASGQVEKQAPVDAAMDHAADHQEIWQLQRNMLQHFP